MLQQLLQQRVNAEAKECAAQALGMGSGYTTSFSAAQRAETRLRELGYTVLLQKVGAHYVVRLQGV